MEMGAGLHFFQKGLSLNEMGPGDIHNHGIILQEGEDTAAYDPLRFLCQRQGKHQYVRFLHCLFQFLHGIGLVKERGLWPASGDGGKAAVEGEEYFGHRLPDAAEAGDEYGLFGKEFLVVAKDMEFSLLQIMELFPKAAVQGDNHAAGGLCNAPCPAAGVAVEADAFRQLFEIQMVHAGSGGLHHGRPGEEGDFIFPDVSHNISGKHNVRLFQGLFPFFFIQFFQPGNGSVREEGENIFFIGFFDGWCNDNVHRISSFV